MVRCCSCAWSSCNAPAWSFRLGVASNQYLTLVHSLLRASQQRSRFDYCGLSPNDLYLCCTSLNLCMFVIHRTCLVTARVLLRWCLRRPPNRCVFTNMCPIVDGRFVRNGTETDPNLWKFSNDITRVGRSAKWVLEWTFSICLAPQSCLSWPYTTVRLSESSTSRAVGQRSSTSKRRQRRHPRLAVGW